MDHGDTGLAPHHGLITLLQLRILTHVARASAGMRVTTTKWTKVHRAIGAVYCQQLAVARSLPDF